MMIPFRPGELKVFRKRKRLPGHLWAERNIHVPIGSRQGLYRNHNNPAMHGVLDWATRSHVRTVVMAKGIQIGGTLAFYSLLLREAEYSADSALIVMADERSVKKLSKKRLQPMIDKSAALSAIKSSDPNDTTIYSITLGHGFTIDIGWASSEMSVSSESYRVVLLDEISKYKVRGNIEDAKSRATVFPDTKKVFIWSSPGVDTDDPNTRDPLMVEAENCDVMLDFHVICPDCHQEQVMMWEQFKWAGQSTIDGKVDADPKAIRRTKSAWYECKHCGSRWNDYKRDKAILAAMKDGWKQTDAEPIEFPQSVYFHFPSWLSPFVSLSDVVADWLEAQGDEEKLRKWHNRHAAVSYRYQTQERKEDDILRLRDERPRGIVPSGGVVQCLLVSADTQQKGFWYEVRAFGWGRSLDNWQIREGFADTFEELQEIAETAYLDSEGKEYRPYAGIIDSGGGTGTVPNHSRTAEVYEFCIANRFWTPVKGMSNKDASKVARKAVEFWPGSAKPMKGGLHRLNINVTLVKDELSGRLHKHPTDPGAWVLHSETDMSYARQMCAENKDGHRWECPKGKANHFWDVGVYLLALAEFLGLKFKEKDRPVQQRRVLSRGVQSNG